MSNPRWTRDELIVTLDFYLTHTPAIPVKGSKEISELSNLLNRLQTKVGGVRPDKFRNQNGVYMKLMNFRRLDPEYKGVGLTRGNKDEVQVWELYASRPDDLRRVADAIRESVLADAPIPLVEAIPSDEEEGQEGQVLTRIHRSRERDSRIVRRKKDRVLKEQESLVCEVCGFDFAAVYGGRGHGFIECHHIRPLSELSLLGEKTKLSDLSLVCSNCHRMIHNGKPWLSVSELKSLLR